MHTYAPTHTHTHTHTLTDMHTYAHTHTHSHTCAPTHTHTHVNVCYDIIRRRVVQMMGGLWSPHQSRNASWVDDVWVVVPTPGSHTHTHTHPHTHTHTHTQPQQNKAEQNRGYLYGTNLSPLKITEHCEPSI